MGYRIIIVAVIIASFFSCATERTSSILSGNESWPIKVDTIKAYSFSSLKIKYQNLLVELNTGSFVTIECEPGVTGMIIWGDGTLTHWNNTTLKKQEIPVNGPILFRFNPRHFESMIMNHDIQKNELKFKNIWKVLSDHFGFAYSSGMEAIIPEPGSYAIWFRNTIIEFDAESSENKVIQQK